MHISGKALTLTTLDTWYYWLPLREDAMVLVRK